MNEFTKPWEAATINKVLRLRRFGFRVWAVARDCGLTEREVREILHTRNIDPYRGLRRCNADG